MNRRVVARLVLGLLVVGVPPALAPAWTIAVASIGAVAVVAAAAAWPERRHAALSVAVGAAIITCAFSPAGSPALAAEGVLILAYFLAGDSRFPGRLLSAGVVATLVVAGALSAHPGASAWLTGIGLVAAVAAFTLVVPLDPGGDGGALASMPARTPAPPGVPSEEKDTSGPPNPLRSDPPRGSRGH